MKKTLCITALCAITALFAGCWKKKDKTDGMNPAMSTDAPIMSDEKPIKVATLDIAPPSPEDRPRETNDEAAIKEKAEDAEEKAEKAIAKAEDAEEKAEDAKAEAEDAEEKADEAMDEKKKQA